MILGMPFEQQTLVQSLTLDYIYSNFPGGVEAEYSGGNIITENMCAQCKDIEGNQYQLLEAIIGHKSDENAVQCAHG